MATNRYALADYILTITLPDNRILESYIQLPEGTKAFSIGGPGENGLDGSFLGSITAKRNEDVWRTEGDPTGSWVHNKSLDRTGEISLEIMQVSDEVIRLSIICNAFQSIQEGIPGLGITITSAADNNNIVATAHDCYITKVPDHDFGESAKTFTFNFTCGRIMFY